MQTAARLASWMLLATCFACGGNQGEAKSADNAAAQTEPGTTESPSTTNDLTPNAGAGTELPAADAQKKGEEGRRTEDIQAAVVAKRPTARACYDEAQKKTPTLEGDITIAWTIDPEGKITEARVDPNGSTIADEGLGKCLIGVIQTLSFPASAGGKETRARYPFNFHPKTKKSNTGY